ncbi:MAG: VWA domain-containing protein [Oleiphilaceae bacterium]|nr:VWA domain-containing protein [Oleiphilaceae bacterium]
MLSLGAPWWLLLIPLPWLLRRKGPKYHGVDAPRMPLTLWTAPLARSGPGCSAGRWLSLLLLSLAWLCLLLALAKPQRVDEQVQLPRSGRDLMLVVDLSPSMQTRDMLMGNRGITRLEAVRRLGSQFIEERRGDRLELVVFSATAHLHAPLTFDHRTVQAFLQESFIGMAGEATAIGDALGLAVKNLQQQPQQPRGQDRGQVILLLTDGDNNTGEITPEMAAELAVAAGIRVHTLGIGSPDPMNTGPGLSGPGDQGAVNRPLLSRLAEQTGGRFFMAETLPDLEWVYQQIDALEPIERDARRVRLSRDLYHWPLAVALLAMVLAASLPRSLNWPGCRIPGLRRRTGASHPPEADHD